MSSSRSRYIGATLGGLYAIYYASTPTDWHFIDNVDLIFHEAGHAIFFFLGEFMQIAMGSGFQVLLPLFISLYFFFTRQRFAGAVTLLWVGMNFINVSVYAGDALTMQLPLLGGDGVIHDWNYLLTSTNLLGFTSLIGRILYALGALTIILGIILSYLFATEAEHPFASTTTR